MEYLFLIGRVLFGGFFMMSGINHFRHVSGMAGYAASKGVLFPKIMVILSGLLILLGGFWIVTGIYVQVGVLEIALFLLPVSFVMHPFWKDTDPAARSMNEIQFKKNMALLGAALMLLMIPLPWVLSLA